jgi:tRNA guanosine-2'-O-methyltransferase
VEAYGYKLSEQCRTGECIPLKFFIMVLSLIEEFEVRQKKLVCQNNAILKGGSDRENSLDHHVLNEKLAESLSLVLVTLLILHIVSYGSFFILFF